MPDDKLRIIDMHGQFAYWADDEEVRRLLRMGYGRGHGTKKRLHEVRLVVSVAHAAEVPIRAAKDLVRLPRDRYHFRDRDLVMGWKLRDVPEWQRKLFGPQTPRDAYRPRERKTAALLQHKQHKKGAAQ